MKNKKLERVIITITAIFVVVTILLMFGGNLFSRPTGSNAPYDMTVMPDATGTTDVIDKGVVVEQSFICSTDSISKIGIVFDREYIPEDAFIVMELSVEGRELATDSIRISTIKDQHRTFLVLPKKETNCVNKEFTLKIYPGGNYDTGLKIMVSEKRDSSYRFGNRSINGTLCFSVTE